MTMAARFLYMVFLDMAPGYVKRKRPPGRDLMDGIVFVRTRWAARNAASRSAAFPRNAFFFYLAMRFISPRITGVCV
jgi:hypothetical protein